MLVPALLLFGIALLDVVLAAFAWKQTRRRMAVVTLALAILAAAAGVLVLRMPVPVTP